MKVLNIEDVQCTIYSVHRGLGYGQIACDPIIKAFHNKKRAKIPTYKFSCFLPFVVIVYTTIIFLLCRI